jgi:hypothetical protein
MSKIVVCGGFASARRNAPRAKRFIFGSAYDVGESVFAPDPVEAMDFTGLEDPGEVLEGRRETSFHGWWHAR